jgi:hypothetical protein
MQALWLRRLGGGVRANFELSGRRIRSVSFTKDAFGELLSTEEGESCILMNVQSASPGKVTADTISFSGLSRMDNALKLHSCRV